MRLVSVEFSENVGRDREWVLRELALGQKNLIVGKNSTGKTRTLHVLASLARVLSTSQNVPPRSGNYICKWEAEGGVENRYEYSVEDSIILSENLIVSGVNYMTRDKDGVGMILFSAMGDNGCSMPFQTPLNEFAIVKRRDKLQHPFIEPLYEWAAAVRHYFFGSSFGKDHFFVYNPMGSKIDERDGNQVVGVFRRAKEDFGSTYVDAVLKDMRSLGYDLEGVDVAFPHSMTGLGFPTEANSIVVLEKGVRGWIDQIVMSQGMFRSLALMAHVNYLILRRASTCIIVDDIGEGLDFERSCLLINLLRAKCEGSSLQVIMSTNDRFVMDEVPLKEWTVLERKGCVVSVRNYSNSAEAFDRFRFTGLSNFSFFEMDFLSEGDADA
jgi:hypothetical protein